MRCTVSCINTMLLGFGLLDYLLLYRLWCHGRRNGTSRRPRWGWNRIHHLCSPMLFLNRFVSHSFSFARCCKYGGPLISNINLLLFYSVSAAALLTSFYLFGTSLKA